MISFRAYSCLSLNRPAGHKGGVALLISKRFLFVTITFPQFDTLEVIGATVNVDGKLFDLVSVYCPRGNLEVAELISLFSCLKNDVIVGGDFNAHHPLWGRSSQSNKAGRSLFDFLTDSHYILCTPPKLEARLDPGSAVPSTLDLTLASPSIASGLTISLGTDWGSDHIPLLLFFDLSLHKEVTQSNKWVFRDKFWPSWNSTIEASLNLVNFTSICDPTLVDAHFNDAVISSSSKFFSSNTSSCTHAKEPVRPWWNSDCQKTVALYRRARSRWIASPCQSTLLHLKKAEAIKKRTILQAKRDSWSSHLSSLSLAGNPKKLWRFCKTMLGSQSNFPLSKQYQIVDSHGTGVLNSADKAAIFLDQFSPVQAPSSAAEAETAKLQAYVNDKINYPDPISPLLRPFSGTELNSALISLKSNATGSDKIHNKMLAHLSSANRSHLLHMFNVFLEHGYVPSQWKKSVIIPLLKPSKPPDKPDSYRPISLTSC